MVLLVPASPSLPMPRLPFLWCFAWSQLLHAFKPLPKAPPQVFTRPCPSHLVGPKTGSFLSEQFSKRAPSPSLTRQHLACFKFFHGFHHCGDCPRGPACSMPVSALKAGAFQRCQCSPVLSICYIIEAQKLFLE